VASSLDAVSASAHHPAEPMGTATDPESHHRGGAKRVAVDGRPQLGIVELCDYARA